MPFMSFYLKGRFYAKLAIKYLMESFYVGLALKNQSSSDNPVILAIERYWMTSCKSRLWNEMMFISQIYKEV